MRYISDYSFAGYMAHIIILSKVANNINAWHIQFPYFLLGSIECIATVILTTIYISVISCIPYTGVITGVKNNNFNKLKENYRKVVKPSEYNVSN
jgi:hypothetical protein